MVVIKASCPTCGDVELVPKQFRLIVLSVAERSYYEFVCPSCRDRVRKSAPPDVIALLESGGVRAEHVNIPLEALEPHAEGDIANDEVLDFILWLAGNEDIAAYADRSV